MNILFIFHDETGTSSTYDTLSIQDPKPNVLHLTAASPFAYRIWLMVPSIVTPSLLGIFTVLLQYLS